MTTLTTLKAEIADDLASGSAFDAVIGTEISRAIKFYSKKNFFFNESRDRVFSTVVGQIWYTGTDDADIPLFLGFSTLHLEKSGENDIELNYIRPEKLELLTDDNSSNNRPCNYTYLNKSVGIYPIPDAIYTVRMTGYYQYPEPASGGETNNPWMVEAYDLIRSRVLWSIFKNKMRDHENALAQKETEIEALNGLEEETSRRLATGKITARYL